MKVGIQGEIGSFSEEAALKLLGGSVEVVCFRHFDEVFQSVASGSADSCVIPLENSLTGSIHRNYDLLRRHQLKIQEELFLPVVHNLIVLPGVAFEDLETVISHPVALGQCEKFFEGYPHLRTEASYDTSGSVREIVERNLRTCGAVAGRRACEVFGGVIVREAIQDSDVNYTRFVLLSKIARVGDGNKTSIVFSFRNIPGGLFKCLSVFALRDVDLTKIESRPITGRPWEYMFYLDFLGSLKDRKVQNALNHLQEIADEFEVLGCYPRDESLGRLGM